MTGLVEITLAGILVTDPELRWSSIGAVTSFTVAADERRFDPATTQWVNTGAVFLPCFIGHHAAENVAESLTKGTHVVVTGVLRQREWESTAGDKRYAYEIHATEVAVSGKDAPNLPGVPVWWPVSALGRAVHLLPADEVFRQEGYPSTSVAVCGEPVTSRADSAEDPSYCPDCVREALRWCAQPRTCECGHPGGSRR